MNRYRPNNIYRGRRNYTPFENGDDGKDWNKRRSTIDKMVLGVFGIAALIIFIKLTFIVAVGAGIAYVLFKFLF